MRPAILETKSEKAKDIDNLNDEIVGDALRLEDYKETLPKEERKNYSFMERALEEFPDALTYTIDDSGKPEAVLQNCEEADKYSIPEEGITDFDRITIFSEHGIMEFDNSMLSKEQDKLTDEQIIGIKTGKIIVTPVFEDHLISGKLTAMEENNIHDLDISLRNGIVRNVSEISPRLSDKYINKLIGCQKAKLKLYPELYEQRKKDYEKRNKV